MTTFRRHERILKSCEFQRVFKHGKKFNCRDFTIYYLLTSRAHSRLGLAVSRRVANAVGRNRIKRFIRESFRQDNTLLGFDFVVIAKTSAATQSNKQLLTELTDLWVKLTHYLNKRSSQSSEGTKSA